MSAEGEADYQEAQQQQPQQQESQKSGGGGGDKLGMVGKILAIVGCVLAVAGYVIVCGSYADAFSSYSFVFTGYVSARDTLLIFVAPVLLLYLALSGDGGEAIKGVCAFCSSALALWSFFVFVAWARTDNKNAAMRGITSGYFFLFIAELVCAITVFVFA